MCVVEARKLPLQCRKARKVRTQRAGMGCVSERPNRPLRNDRILDTGYWGPWTNAESTFSNEYFRLLVEEKWTIKTTHNGKK